MATFLVAHGAWSAGRAWRRRCPARVVHLDALVPRVAPGDVVRLVAARPRWLDTRVQAAPGR